MIEFEEFKKRAAACRNDDNLVELYHVAIDGMEVESITPFNELFLFHRRRITDEFDLDLKRIAATVTPSEKVKRKRKASHKMMPFTDHLGNVFRSFESCVKHYGKNASCVRKRLEKGISLEKALTLDFFEKEEPFVDHNGHKFRSIRHCIMFYKLSMHKFYKRINAGMEFADVVRSLVAEKTRKEKAAHD